MTRLAKGILLTVGVVFCVLLLYLAYAYWNLKLQSAAADRARAELDVGYQAQLLEYLRALRIGTPRSEVLEYLQSRKIAYSDRRGVITVDLGREPDVFPCNYWTVYVAFEFAQPQPAGEASPQDLLGGVSLKRIGHCP